MKSWAICSRNSHSCIIGRWEFLYNHQEMPSWAKGRGLTHGTFNQWFLSWWWYQHWLINRFQKLCLDKKSYRSVSCFSADVKKIMKWAASWQNQQNDKCAQRRLRSAWAFTQSQSDQSSLSAWRKLGSLATHWARSENSDQTGRMPRLIWVFAVRSRFVCFVMRQLRCGMK